MLKNGYGIARIISELPAEITSIKDLIKYDITIFRKYNEVFIRPVHQFDILDIFDEKIKETIKDSTHCEVSFVEVDGRMQRHQVFVKDLQLLSGMN